MINVFEPTIGDEEREAVQAVLDGTWIGKGPRVAGFETSFARAVGTKPRNCVSTNSCTEALFQVLSVLNLSAADQVVLPSISFVGAAHAVVANGAQVVLCDVEAHNLNPSLDKIQQVTTEATKAVIVLHYGGNPGDVLEIAKWARSEEIVLIEDAACALGASAGGESCGTIGDFGVWSFDAMKVATSGDGGMIWSRDANVATELRRSTYLGISSGGFGRKKEEGWWKIDPTIAGRRSIMNEISAALGEVQLHRLPELLRRRAEIAQAYDAGLANVSWIRCVEREPEGVPTFYSVEVANSDRDRLAHYLLDHGIYTTFRYWPLHKTKLYGADSKRFPVSEQAAADNLLLPLHAGLSGNDIETVLRSISKFPPEPS